MHVNDRGTIYYGTDIKYIEELDKEGLTKPRCRDEQYISVSISGYKSAIPITHPELIDMARVYSQEMQICTLKDQKLYFKTGYENTLTYIEGFGPNPSQYLKSYYGLVVNNRTANTMTAVLNHSAHEALVQPEKARTFEYMSSALHGFIAHIVPDMIEGWIVPEQRYHSINELMDKGKIRRLKLWKDTDFKPIQYDMGRKVMYGLFPTNIDMYVRHISRNKYYAQTRINHLKSILRLFSDINWHMPLDKLEQQLEAWLHKHKDSIIWNSEEQCYLWN
ncbi:hypothetical protein HZI73_12800 [Vallitalea pronyensis]|uniref:Uncharacterized protein n=1 Tax=Vallitalea pronyensis TaxID=1348613 RepID=A0A8J8SH05_9FIRM|nr:hypothetical protein [Vallitalea pronyensis]QUI23111.1 hypothetical protein HZI73_12800 [Vallitalea pronyensis]